ncbi:MAG TPA: lytic murein transglycosylase B [Burkholderiales bacterium]|nr:lytic murein transglycosylase B [Burkholderiales bacterium]
MPLFPGNGYAVPLNPEIEVFIHQMAERYYFNTGELHQIFSHVKLQPEVLRAISLPASALPWNEYRTLFINPTRIADGVKFWDQNAETLSRARQQYGVSEEIIVATIGVETRYGRNTGTYRVLDALTTLAFDYPQRASFFRQELEQFLLLTREERINPLTIKGSYAGAMGMPQFIPSAYRRYAVDFDGDGDLNLWKSPADAIGSIAHYLKDYGWKPDEPVAVGAQVNGDEFRELLLQDIKPHVQVDELQKIGVTPMQEIPGENLASLFALGEGNEAQYWLALNNFYVITRYNHSTYYAMSVYELGRAIREVRDTRSAAK